MVNPDKIENNKNIEGYKVEGDGNAPNTPPEPGNATFEKNPDALNVEFNDIPGKDFNINDKAYFDSSKKDFVKTVSAMHHADENLSVPQKDELPK